MKSLKENLKISIIIVHYHVKKDLFECISSIINSDIESSFEIIIVDNDERKVIEKELKKKFVDVLYIPSLGNNGYGAGNNLGAITARGKYLFFLNPDTLILPYAINNLINFLKQQKDVGLVAPQLLDKDKQIYHQGESLLTPIRGIVGFSFLNKLFPHNPISKKYWLTNADTTKVRKVDVVPGTACMIRKEVFEKIGGFDERFFLFFEEFDLCKRLREKGYHNYIIPESQVIHYWGRSTEKNSNTEKIFKESRRKYFKKHFGFFSMALVEFFTNISVYHFSLFGILLLSSFLFFYRLSTLMTFIGDQGWFYLSARDMLVTGKVPLVGIASSHPWIHQGAFWTYLLSVVFALTNFNPVSGAYLTGVFGLLTVVALYIVSSNIFSRRAAIIASVLYATSPFVIFQTRMSYHTSPIPFFTVLFLYSVYKWLKGNELFFPLVIFFLAILYNFEIATSVFSMFLVGVILSGIYTKQKWLKKIATKRILLFSFFAYLIPMTPMLIYDVSHGFPQTLQFLAWIGYRILLLFGYPAIHSAVSSTTIFGMFSFLSVYIQRILFLPNILVANCLFILLLVFIVSYTIRMIRREKYDPAFSIVTGVLFLSLSALILSKTPSEAYLLMILPEIFLLLGFMFDRLLQMKYIKLFIPPFICFITIINTYMFVSQNFKVDTRPGPSYFDRLQFAQTIVNQAKGEKYTLSFSGPGSEYPSAVMNYEYLTWWLGNGPSKSRLHFTIREVNGKVSLKKTLQ